MMRHLKRLIFSLVAARLGRMLHRHGGHGGYGHGQPYGYHGHRKHRGYGHGPSYGYHGHYRFKGHYRKKRRRY
ncbi:hypothetical protein O7627_25310 [Solwaraspora sp. WMMD1047]|uniref:hypothetical protein n=1 Tax=Solwaraspora sp. WMMD1047 TaxID=3016102 RepID=UPI002416D30E|nr:hypothetical protein [Solwaraspora sp. WMMD1047]MDG4832604.1 hypothetical protein [Solwaraspora sp. WMMD1047]